MPAWTERPGPEELGGTRHQLEGQRIGALVDVVPAQRMTILTVALLVDGTDEATVDRCKRRAEQLIAAGLRP